IVLGGDEPRIDDHAAGVNLHVVHSAAKLHASELRDPKTPAVLAVFGLDLIDLDHAVCDGFELRIARLARRVIEEETGDLPSGEELFKGENLPPITKRALGQEMDFRQRVDDDTRGVEGLDLLENSCGGFRQLDLGGLKERVVPTLGEIAADRDLSDLDPLERPAVRSRRGTKLV